MSTAHVYASTGPVVVNFVGTANFILDENTTSLEPSCLALVPLYNPSSGYKLLPRKHLLRCPKEIVPNIPIELPVKDIWRVIFDIMQPWEVLGCVDIGTFYFFKTLQITNPIKYIRGHEELDELLIGQSMDPMEYGRVLAIHIQEKGLAYSEPPCKDF